MKHFSKKPPIFAKKSAKPSNQKLKSQDKTAAQSADDAIHDFGKVNFITITDNQDGQRIDNFLLARLKGLPRSHLYKLIRDDEVRINGKRCKPHDRVYSGDVVRVAPVRIGVREQVVVSDDMASGLKERVVYEDEGLIVLDKPFGMAVHGGSGVSAGVIETLRVATGKKYLELIHRIDKETSGLLLIAKKRSTLKLLQEQFRQKTIHKNYLCVVAGHTKFERTMIDKPLLKYTLASGERRVKVANDGKPSQTHVQTLARFMLDGKPVSLIKASPLTGRTHQIRVHLASISHALLGDDKYYQGETYQGVRRLCLHAYELFLDKNSEDVNDRPTAFCAKVPTDFCEILGMDIISSANLRVDTVDK